jgi:hypothetical protein
MFLKEIERRKQRLVGCALGSLLIPSFLVSIDVDTHIRYPNHR